MQEKMKKGIGNKAHQTDQTPLKSQKTWKKINAFANNFHIRKRLGIIGKIDGKKRECWEKEQKKKKKNK